MSHINIVALGCLGDGVDRGTCGGGGGLRKKTNVLCYPNSAAVAFLVGKLKLLSDSRI